MWRFGTHRLNFSPQRKTVLVQDFTLPIVLIHKFQQKERNCRKGFCSWKKEKRKLFVYLSNWKSVTFTKISNGKLKLLFFFLFLEWDFLVQGKRSFWAHRLGTRESTTIGRRMEIQRSGSIHYLPYCFFLLFLLTDFDSFSIESVNLSTGQKKVCRDRNILSFRNPVTVKSIN